MKWLVCGGRHFSDFTRMIEVFDHVERKYGKPTLVIHDTMPGTGKLAGAWARMVDHKELAFPADWRGGKSAGPRRNQKMLDEGRPDLVIAFPGGSGTEDMVRRAKAAGVEVVEVGV
jgi:hypothetical protein